MNKLAFLAFCLVVLNVINGEGIYEEQKSAITIISPPIIAGTKLTSAYTLFTKVPKLPEDEISGTLASCINDKICLNALVSQVYKIDGKCVTVGDVKGKIALTPFIVFDCNFVQITRSHYESGAIGSIIAWLGELPTELISYADNIPIYSTILGNYSYYNLEDYMAQYNDVQVAFVTNEVAIRAYRNYSGMMTSYYFFTCLVFGIISIYAIVRLIPRIPHIRQIIKTRSLLELTYFFIILAAQARFWYHAIDFRGYRGIMSDTQYNILDALGTAFIMSVFAFILSSWAEVCMKEKVLNIYQKAQIVAIIFNVVVYVVSIGIIIASPTVDDDMNYFLAGCILVIVIAMTIFGGNILYRLSKAASLKSTKTQLYRFRSYVITCWIIGVLFIVLLITIEFGPDVPGPITFNILYRILEATLLIITVYMIRLPSNKKDKEQDKAKNHELDLHKEKQII